MVAPGRPPTEEYATVYSMGTSIALMRQHVTEAFGPDAAQNILNFSGTAYREMLDEPSRRGSAQQVGAQTLMHAVALARDMLGNSADSIVYSGDVGVGVNEFQKQTITARSASTDTPGIA
jgi:hypothetical protein